MIWPTLCGESNLASILLTKTIMCRKFLLPTMVLAFLAVVPCRAFAIPFDIGTESKVIANIGNSDGENGLSVTTTPNPLLSQIKFDLNSGDKFTFDFFTIAAAETWINSDDYTPTDIIATLDFDVPDTVASLNGVTVGGSVLWLGQYATLTWEALAPITVNGTTFLVELSNNTFGKGLGGLSSKPTTVTATVKLIGSNYAAVPDNGSSAMLLGLAFLSFALLRPKRITA